MKPPAFGHISNSGKHGSVRPDIIIGGRLPSNSIWPRQHEICMVLTVEPLAPDPTINCKLLSGNLQSKPAGKQILFEQNLRKLMIECKKNQFINQSDYFSLVDSICVAIQC